MNSDSILDEVRNNDLDLAPRYDNNIVLICKALGAGLPLTRKQAVARARLD